MDKDRRLAFLILKKTETDGTWSNLALKDAFSVEKPEDPAFVRELVYGVIRNRKLLDYNIGRFLSRPKLSVSERTLLRMGLYQLAFMDSVKDHAAVYETVALASSFIRGRQGFINAVLRSIQRDGVRLLDDGLSTRYSCAQWIIDLWEKHYGAEKTEELLRAGNTPAPFVVRANTLKTGRDELIKLLQDEGFTAQACTDSALCVKVSGSGVLDTDLYKSGFFSVQGEASCNAVELLSPRPGNTVLDLCAAPGGKSCAAAEMMNGVGKVVSFDVYPHRVKLIEKEASRLGIDIINAKTANSAVFDKELEASADCVIADVPCSGLGTLRRNPEIKLSERSETESLHLLEELSEIQYNILLNALKYIRPDGKVLYSTCTIDPVENGELVRRVLSDVPGYRIDLEQQLFTEAGGHDGFYSCIIKEDR